MKFRKIWGLIQLLFIVLWMVLIFVFSNQTSTNSLESSDRVLFKVVEVIKRRELTPADKVRIKKKYTFFIRKLAHFTLYFILGATVYILLSTFIENPIKPILISLLICFIYACTDEIHQIYVPGRTSRFFDVIIDTCGAMSSIGLILVLKSFYYMILCIFKKEA